MVSAADTVNMFCWIFTALLLLFVIVDAEPCARLYLKGLDSSTTFYPQLAGVYKLQTSLLSQWMRGYPIYQHELDELYLYYNSTQTALVIGQLQSPGLLKVQPRSGAQITSDVNYALKHLFTFSSWKQWDHRQRRFVENRNLSDMSLQCVSEIFGFCSSGYLYPDHVYRSRAMWSRSQGIGFDFELIDISQLSIKLIDGVFYDLRPVYEVITEHVNQSQWYLFHKNGKWRVGAEIGTSHTVLEMEGNAMRVEYENDTDWFLITTSVQTGGRAFDRLQCSRELPDGMSCETDGALACDNGGTCHVDSDGVSSCLCAAGYRGIQCKHRISECPTSFRTPPRAFVFKDPIPNYEGNIMTVFCFSGENEYSVCQNRSWQPTDTSVCRISTTTTSTTASSTTRRLESTYSQSEYIVQDSSESIATVIVVLVLVQLGFPFLCYCCIACCRSDEDRVDEEVPVTDEQKAPEHPKHKATLQSTCSGFFYVSWWAWLAFVIICFGWYGSIPLDGSTVISAVAIMAFVCLAVLYCCVFSETFCSREYNYLTELEGEVVTAGEQIAELKAAKPTIIFRAECSHNETRSRTVSDSYGQHLETYTERMKGAVIEEPFMYTDCFDNSANFLPPLSYVTKVQLELAVEFADDESKRVHEEAYEDFKARHLTCDEFVEFSIRNDLPGFVKTLTVHDPEHSVPSWMTSSCFCLVSCLCLTWPYRLILNSSITNYSYRIVKKVLARSVPVVSQPQSIGGYPQPPSGALSASPPPFTYPTDRLDDSNSVPIIPLDHLPSVPPPSYEEFTANPNMFPTKKAVQESIALSELRA